MDTLKLFKKIESSTLHTLYKAHSKLHDIEMPDDDEEIAEVLKGDIDAIGARYLTTQLKLPQLVEIGMAVGVKLKDNNTKSYFSKRMVEIVRAESLNKFVSKMKTAQIVLCLSLLGVSTESTDPKVLAASLEAEIRLAGLESFLSTMKMDTLKAVAEDMDLNVPNATTNSLLTAISTGKPPGKKPVVTKEVKITKSKPKLDSKATVENIFQHYNKDELENFCRSHDLKVSGKKRELAERIVDYFADGKENKTNSNQKEEDEDAEMEEGGENNEEEEEEPEKEASGKKGDKAKGKTNRK